MTKPKASVAHPQTNGLTEATNKNITNAMKKKLDEAKGLWAEELPGILWGLRTMPNSSTKETPFTLAYGQEAVIPAEMGVNTLRVSQYCNSDNGDKIQLNLDLIDEIREDAQVMAAARRQQVAKYYNARVRPRTFAAGDLVLRNCHASKPPAELKKLSPTWEGPYQVVEVVGRGAYRLRNGEGKTLPNTWNAQHLTKYYQ